MALAAAEAGWQVTRLSQDLTCPTVEGRVIVYGDGLTARIVAEKYGLDLIAPEKDWLVNLSRDYTRRFIETCLYKDLMVPNAPKFIKCSDTKWFYPGIFYEKMPVAEGISDDEMLLVQEPVDFLYEFRYFILDNEIRTGCQYKRMGVASSTPSGSWITDPWLEKDARDFLNEFLKKQEVPKAVVIDVGMVKDRGLAIIEANPAYASGIYSCNPRQVLEVVERSQQ
jgi:hypothetical protein